MMRVRIMRYVALLIPVFLFGCTKDSSGPGIPAQETYPVAVGNSWTYARTAMLTNFRPKDPTVTYTPDTVSATASVLVTRQLKLPSLSGGDSITVAEFEKSEYLQGTWQTYSVGYQYFELTQEAMLLHGYRSPGPGSLVGPSAPRRAIRYTVNGHTFTSLEELSAFLTAPLQALNVDSLVREDPPARVLQFPLQRGATWTYKQQPWRIGKEVTGETSLSLNGVVYFCAEIRWLYDMNGDGKWDDDISILDYVSPEGSIVRHMEVLNLIVSSEANPDGIGTADWKDEYVLTSAHLH